MIFVLDNYDSFTYNIIQYLGKFTKDIQVFRHDKITVNEVQKLAPKGIIISPGPKDPQHAGITKELIKQCMGHIPILGVCLGHQAIGEVLGGRVIRSEEVIHGKTSEIYHNQKEIFKNIPSPMIMTRYHSLIVDKESLPSNIDIIAETKNNIIMGIKSQTISNLWGVQFHPESILSKYGIKIIQNFYEYCV